MDSNNRTQRTNVASVCPLDGAWHKRVQFLTRDCMSQNRSTPAAFSISTVAVIWYLTVDGLQPGCFDNTSPTHSKYSSIVLQKHNTSPRHSSVLTKIVMFCALLDRCIQNKRSSNDRSCTIIFDTLQHGPQLGVLGVLASLMGCMLFSARRQLQRCLNLATTVYSSVHCN